MSKSLEAQLIEAAVTSEWVRVDELLSGNDGEEMFFMNHELTDLAGSLTQLKKRVLHERHRRDFESTS